MTYKEIIECVKGLDHRGRTVKTCWIAEVKRKLGLTKRVAWNRGRGKGSQRCPEDLRQLILRCFTSC